MTAKSLCMLIGILFLAVGLFGFIDNPVIGDSPDTLFYTDMLHNGVHIGSGVLFLMVPVLAPAATNAFMILFGIIYLLIGVLGLIDFGTGGAGKVLGILHVNGADNLLHIGLGLVIIVIGIGTRAKPATS